MALEILELSVEGMSCQHCVKAVKESVGALPGVDSVEVSLERELVTVTHDPAKVGRAAMKAAIEDAGYSVR
jgi:copper chaperone